MNKELILKYKEEFDYWLNGGKLCHCNPEPFIGELPTFLKDK